MTADTQEVLNLYPGGYPVHIDLPQRQVDGAGTALRFTLPLRGLNFPLSHAHETKLVVALAGELALRAGAGRQVVLGTGQATLVPPGTAHRIAQHGSQAATVGVVLWPGAVEEAFRALDRHVARHGFPHAAVAALFAQFGVEWDTAAGPGAHAAPLAVTTFQEAARALPAALRQPLASCWGAWLPAPA